MSRNAKIAALIIGLILSAVLVAGAFLIFQTKFGKAAGTEPQDMTVTVAGTEANPKAIITFKTDQPAKFFVRYGSSPTSTNLIVESPEETSTPSFEVIGLAPATTYYYVVGRADSDAIYDNGGVAWTFTTKSNSPTDVPTPTLSPTPVAKKTIEPTPTKTAVVPTLDEGAIERAIKEEYTTWDTSCAKKYSARLCVKYMPKKTQ